MNRSIFSVASFCVSLVGCLTLWFWELNLPPACRQFPDNRFPTIFNLICGLMVLGISFGLTVYINDIRDRQINEEKLRTSEARFKQAQRVAQVGSWEFIPSTGEIIWSEEMFRLFGLDPQQNEPNYTEFIQLVHPEDRDFLNETIERSLREGIPFESDHRIIRSDGSVRHLEGRGNVIRNAKGEVIRMFETGRDISERKQIEIALEQTNAYYQSLADVLPQCVYRKDVEGRLTFGNRAYLKTLGKSLEEVIGWTVDDVYPLELAKKYAADDRRVIETGEVLDIIEQHKAPTREKITYVQVVKAPVRDESGNIIATQGIFWDITERIHLEQALQASEAKLRDVLNRTIASIISYRIFEDGEWEYLYVSAGSEVILGYTSEELMGDITLWKSRVIREDWETVFVPILEELSDETTVSVEYRFRSKDGSIRWIASNLTARRDLSSPAWIVTLVGTDISEQQAALRERKQLELALKESEKRLRLILDSSPYAIFLKDLQGCYTYVNPAYERMTNLSQDQLLGQSDYDFLPPEFAETCDASDRAAIVAKRPIIFEEEVPFNQGTRTLLITKFPLLDPTDQCYEICGIVLDISDRFAAELALKASQAQLQDVLSNTAAAVVSFRLFENGTWKYDYYSPTCQNIYGYSSEEFLANPNLWQSRVLPEDWETILIPAFEEALTGTSQKYIEYRFLHQNGSIRWIGENANIRRDDTQNCWIITVVSIDITHRKQAEFALQRQTQQEKAFNRFVQLIRNSLDLKTIFLTAVQEAAELININRVAVVQYQPENQCWVHREIYSRDGNLPETRDLRIPDENNPIAEQLKRGEIVRIDDTNTISDPINQGIIQDFPGAWLLIPLVVNGIVWGSFSLLKNRSASAYQDEQIALACRFADQLAIAIQQSQLYEKLQQANEQLHYLANHDQLTQIPNRRYFDEYLEREWKRCVREQTPLTLILCDLDYFKRYNDTYGHPAGDQCLFNVAQTLQQTIRRPADFVARYGGEEFAIILSNTNAEGAIHVVEMIQDQIRVLNIPHVNSLTENRVTLSFGIACTYPTVQTSIQALIDTADRALYQTKERGRNSYSLLFLQREIES
ncbi:PAS domain S-box protein [Capilliphycus salinus ALCB114379]|uniref:PAS domain S-box protein n=1 Tax=Capilliphycus salinus TaxID=2768948 RepID=UPI0039A5F4DE